MARDHLKDLRKAQKLSQAALAKLTGLTAPEISRIECGYRDISPDETLALAKALKVAPERILGNAPSPAKPVIGLGLAVAAPKIEPAIVSHSDLNDPANFRELPDAAILECGSLDALQHRARLTEALKRANQVLHTSKVPAAVWRAWREFEKRLQEQLRG